MMRNNEKIKVGYLIAYDYEYLKYSLPQVYDYADSIALAIDKDRLTWSGTPFQIEPSFFGWLKEFDKQNKISIYEDTFYVPSLASLDSETRERKMLTKYMGDGGWHIQIDVDEYFLDFPAFIDYLLSLDYKQSTLIYAELITIFKQNETEFFLIDSNERFPLASNAPEYIRARAMERKDRKTIFTRFKLLHQSWGRTTEEMEQKLSNWGHKTDFDIDSYFSLWKVINKHTYKFFRNFHPLGDGRDWVQLEYVKANSIFELIDEVKISQEQKEENKRNKPLWKRLFSKKKYK